MAKKEKEKEKEKDVSKLRSKLFKKTRKVFNILHEIPYGTKTASEKQFDLAIEAYFYSLKEENKLEKKAA
jgi:hypothetical protein